MSRRNDTPVPEFHHARKAPLPNAGPQSSQATQAEEVQQEAKAEEVTLPHGEHFPTKDELDAAIAQYRAHPGKCPICNCKIGRGVAGHLSKCLRSSKFKTASTPTS